MTPLLPKMRAIVDWNDDAFFEPTDGQSKPNLIPTAISLVDLDIVGVSTGTFTHEAEVTDYGIRYQRVVTGAGVFGGIRYGFDDNIVDDIPVALSTSYRITAWVRGVSGSIATPNMIIQAHKQGTPPALGSVIVSSSDLTLTADWQQISASFTTDGSTSYIAIGVIKNDDATDITFDVAGLMLTAGIEAVSYYNSGDTYAAYEDISADVMQATWSVNMNTKTRTPDEGSLSLRLMNDTRKYSPRYASSVLYGAFKHGLRVRVEVKHNSGAWEVMWAGWVIGYGVNPGNVNYQSTIMATQGVFNLDAVPLQDNLQEDVTFDGVLPNILFSGWYPAITPYVFVADISKADEDAWTPDIDDFTTILDTGITEFPLVGDGWVDTDTRGSKVLKDLMEVEQGWLYLGRDGRMNFKSRESVQWNSAADYSIDLDSEATREEYVFAPAEINSVNLTYYPSGESDNQILWTRRGKKFCPARDARRVEAKFQYEEGEKKTVKSINAFGDGGDDSTLSATIEGGGVYDSRYYYATVELRNGKGVIAVYNQGPLDAYFSLTLKGTIEVNADSEQVQVVADNTDDIRDIRINNKLLKDENMATDLGNFIITRHGADYDEFRSLSMMSRDGNWLDRMLNIEIGNIVSLSEAQTVVTDKLHFITGGNFEWLPGQLHSTFQTTRVDETEYWILGTSKLSHETVLAY